MIRRSSNLSNADVSGVRVPFGGTISGGLGLSATACCPGCNWRASSSASGSAGVVEAQLLLMAHLNEKHAGAGEA